MFDIRKIIITFRYPIMLLLLLWSNINSGYWNLREFNTPIEYFHAFRASMPYVLFPMALLLRKYRPSIGGRDNPVKWLEKYGWVVLVASLLSPVPIGAFYFSMAYLACVYVPQFMLYNWEEKRGERLLIYITWIIIGAYALGILALARGQLFSAGYGITGVYKGGVGGMAMSRSSGIARFFAISGLITFARCWTGKMVMRVFWAAAAVLCALVVWSMQSRGAMIGYAAAMAFFILVMRSSRWVTFGIILAIVMICAAGMETTLVDQVLKQLERGQDQEQLQSMSGRTLSYKQGIKIIKEHPFLGQGGWSDTLSGVGHVHNTYLRALMDGGIIGFFPFMMSWWMGWRLLIRLIGQKDLLSEEDKQLLTEAGLIIVFFTVRSIPETTIASFAVDSIALVCIYLYLVVLEARINNQAVVVQMESDEDGEEDPMSGV